MTVRRAAFTGLAVLAGLATAACAMNGDAGRPARAGATAVAPPSDKISIADKGYLSGQAAIDSLSLLPPPPAAGSPVAVADRAVFDATRALEGGPRWRQAARDADLSGPEVFKATSCAVGATVGPATTPTLTRIWAKMFRDSVEISAPVKDRYKRPRPLIGNDKPICTAREKWLETNGSYPSGHSMIGWSWALVLAEIAPDRADAALKRGRDFGDSRMVCGVHFQSDVEAGRDLAAAMMARLHAEPAFQADLAAARKELAAARARGPAPQGCGEQGA
ncbi:phosphatase PAP2 family protein [Caulobacter sp. CCUG 60055]|uniref:acid phosphatase n=1 Tax=Caulobacter sp. CCUG 60055 TaxID=2100090 RepID=UPI001FA8121E|nr:phosphatase PAP2 family protein [Caulobacter sp. CCUG 60055]